MLVRPRRPFIKAEDTIPKAARAQDQVASRFVQLIAKLYRAEALAKDWAPARRLLLRSRYRRAVVREIEQMLLTHLHRVAPSSLLGEALHTLHGQWPKLVRFLDSGSWPLDSNPVENAIRPFVVGRRSWLFADTMGGANASANLYSLIETAKRTTSSPGAASSRSSRSCRSRRPWTTTKRCWPGTSHSTSRRARIVDRRRRREQRRG